MIEASSAICRKFLYLHSVMSLMDTVNDGLGNGRFALTGKFDSLCVFSL